MIKAIKNRFIRLTDVRVITLKNLSNHIEKEMKKISQIKYDFETDRFSNKKVLFKICSFFLNVFCFIVSVILSLLMSFLLNDLFWVGLNFPYFVGSFFIFQFIIFLAFGNLLIDMLFNKKVQYPDFLVEELKNDFKIFLYPDDTKILDDLVNNLNKENIINIKKKLKIKSTNVKEELDAIFKKIETKEKVNNREKMIVAWQLGQIPYKDFDIVFSLLDRV